MIELSTDGMPWDEAKANFTFSIEYERRKFADNEAILITALRNYGADFAPTSSFKRFFETYESWRCPSCGRRKVDLIRPDSNGRLMTNIARHHDHCYDAARAYFKRKLAKCADDPDALNGRFWRKIEAFRRFPPTLICQDCNMVDVGAKRFVGASKYFSFSPEELAQIFMLDEKGIPRADRDRALATFPAAQEEHRRQCSFAKSVILAMFAGATLIETDDSNEDEVPTIGEMSKRYQERRRAA